MIRSHITADLSRLEDWLMALAATAYFTGFIAAIEITLGKLAY